MPDDKTLLNQAVKSMKQGDYSSAIESFSELITKTKSTSMLFNRGLCYYLKNDYALAKDDFQTVYKKGTKEQAYPKSVYYLWQVFEKMGEKEEAMIWKEKYDKLNSNENKPEEESDQHGVKQSEQTETDDDGLIKSLAFFKSNITFKDVIGMDEAKTYLEKNVVLALKNPDLYRYYGKKLGDGVILYGGAGCGKTYLAKAAAGEANGNMIIVKASDVMSMYVGASEKNIANVFKFARKHTPCILFFDEIDALGSRRSSSLSDTKGEGSALRLVINSLLVEMQGIETNPEGIFVIGATNKIYDIDPALRRSGRFSTAIYIRQPNFNERISLLRYYLKGKPIHNINYTKLALILASYSQADIARICDISLLAPLSESFKTGVRRPLNTDDIVKTIKKEMPESPLVQWMWDAKGEIIGKTHVEIVDKKVHETFKSGILDAGEKISFKPLIKDVLQNTVGFGSKLTTLQRKLGYALP